MKANQPSPPKQVSVLFKRKTEVLLSESQSSQGRNGNGGREAEYGEGKISARSSNAYKDLYLMLFFLLPRAQYLPSPLVCVYR